jgi:hypothetical protein
MSRYYFVVNSLPEIVLGHPAELSFLELIDFLGLNLTEQDLLKVGKIREWIDLLNLKAHLLGYPIDPRGSLSEKEMEEAILVREDLGEQVIAFLDDFETREERLDHFPSLLASFFKRGEAETGFLGAYFRLEREIALLLGAARCIGLKRDLVRELRYEDPTDPFVAYLLAQKDGGSLLMPLEYEGLDLLLKEKRPRELFLSLLKYRFDKILELEERHPFAIDQVLGYLARLLLAESWTRLDEEKGAALLHEALR